MSTHSQWVPTMFVRLMKLTEQERHGFDLSSLRMAVHSAAPCPADVKLRHDRMVGPHPARVLRLAPKAAG